MAFPIMQITIPSIGSLYELTATFPFRPTFTGSVYQKISLQFLGREYNWIDTENPDFFIPLPAGLRLRVMTISSRYGYIRMSIFKKDNPTLPCIGHIYGRMRTFNGMQLEEVPEI